MKRNIQQLGETETSVQIRDYYKVMTFRDFVRHFFKSAVVSTAIQNNHSFIHLIFKDAHVKHLRHMLGKNATKPKGLKHTNAKPKMKS